MHQSIPAAPSPLPPGWPPGISIIFAFDGKFPGWGLLSCQMPRGPPSSLQYFSLIAQSNNAVLSILMGDNYIDVYIIWVTLEALFPNLQCTTKCCKNATMYRKIFIFLNQMLLNMFTHVLLTQIKCISGLLHSVSEKMKKHTHTHAWPMVPAHTNSINLF